MDSKLRTQIAQTVQTRLDAMGKSQTGLAAYLGLHPSTVSKWCSGIRTPRPDKIDDMCDFLGITRDALLGTRSPARVNVYAAVHAGIPNDAVDDVVGWEDLSPRLAASGKPFFGVEVRGDSMEPEYRDGDVVIVELTPTCENGDVCVVRVGGDDAVLRRVIIKPTQTILQPFNRAYDPIAVTGPDFAVVGVVRELRRTI